jgi:hypothetical protein
LCSRVIPEIITRAPFGFLTKLSGIPLSAAQFQRKDRRKVGAQQQWSLSWSSGGNDDQIENLGELTPIQSRSVPTKSRSKKKAAT